MCVIWKAENEEVRSWWARLRAIRHEIIDMVRPGKCGYRMEDLIGVTQGAPVVGSDYSGNEEIHVVGN